MASQSICYQGRAKTLEEAVKKAHGQIPKTPGIADELIRSRMTSIAYETGGIAGFADFVVEVEKI